MKLFNAIAVFDVYVVAESSESARAALLAAIDAVGEGIAPMEITATEALRENAIRTSWREERPYVAMDVPDDDFKKCAGKTTFEMFKLLYTKGKS
jgi:hypothetical protein